jgi:hypothetical protein
MYVAARVYHDRRCDRRGYMQQEGCEYLRLSATGRGLHFVNTLENTLNWLEQKRLKGQL